MSVQTSPQLQSTLDALRALGLLSAHEQSDVLILCSPSGHFADVLALAETIHLHIKVDDTESLPVSAFLGAGAMLDHTKIGFVKYHFPSQVNAIFSHIKVSQDELIETAACRRSRPFLDHIGIDLREENATVRCAFAMLPQSAQFLQWPHVAQGGCSGPVYCCHTQVSEKRWLYPPGDANHPGIPLEFAYGPLVVDPEKSGCDLRPLDPRKGTPAVIPCCDNHI